MEFLVAGDPESLLEQLPKLVSFKEAGLLSGRPSEIGQFFHDYTVGSASVQANVAEGGLKIDLSAVFDGKPGDEFPDEFSTRFIYSNSDKPFPDDGSNSDIRWSLYGNYARLYQLDGGERGSALDGLIARRPDSYELRKFKDETAAPTVTRYEPRMDRLDEPILMPTVIRVDMMFSLVARLAHQGRGTKDYPYQLHMMYLPIITLHNPYNAPLKCKGLQVEFSNVPIGFQFVINGRAATQGGLVPFNRLYIGDVAQKAFAVTLSNSQSTESEVVMGPGETLIFGTPFNPNATWASELETNGRAMFDWANNRTSNVKMVSGLITGPADGIGFDIDWLAPNPREAWVNARRNEGVLLLGINDRVALRYGPLTPEAANGVFSITTRMSEGGSTQTNSEKREFGRTQFIYNNDATLTPLLAEGTSPRYTEKRSFPMDFPPAGSPPLRTSGLVEQDNTPFRNYVKARPFTVFSVGAKTTVESFTKSRPIADNGMVFHMATCDFRESVSQGSKPLEFALVPVENGSSAIESDGKKAFFFGGHGSTNGTTTAAIYEVPLAPLQSIAQLRHANGASLAQEPFVTYSVGESRAHPAIPAEHSFSRLDGGRVLLDHSWLANSSLWDRYWFSTLSTLQGPAYSEGSSMSRSKLANRFFAQKRDLPNARNMPYFPAGVPQTPESAAESALESNGRMAAAYVMTKGGFNANSTSVRAWEAVLSGLSNEEIAIVVGGGEDGGNAPFPRLRRPVFGRNSSDVSSKEKLWSSYRALEKDEIKLLAEKIVDEVRKRGPFLSMSDFVNRRLGASGELTNSGAIQAALDKSGVNAIMESNARQVTTEEVSGYGWRNPDAVWGNTGAGAPGEISQGDVLSAIGSFMTVRSDTFVVRCCGDARDRNGKILARAVCEATVQRVADYVETVEMPDAVPTQQANIRFGRRFEIMAFRWLKPNEI